MRLASLMCALAALGIAGCGSGKDGKSSSSQGGAAAATTATAASSSGAAADLASYKGIYVATLTKAQLARGGAPESDFPAGNWTMSIAETSPATIRLDPGGFDLTATSLANDRLVTQPDPTCPTPQGRTQGATFTVTKTATGLRFTTVRAGCKADAAALTATEWRKT
jgi:hypothetical protein